jgi:hypothetical protein
VQDLPTTEQLRRELFKKINEVGGVECQEYPDIFVPVDIVDNVTLHMDYKFLKMVCDRCPVKQLCGEYAISFIPDHGMWGGMTPSEIRKLGRKRYPNARRSGRDFLGDWIATQRNRPGQTEESWGESDLGPMHLSSGEGSARESEYDF